MSQKRDQENRERFGLWEGRKGMTYTWGRIEVLWIRGSSVRFHSATHDTSHTTTRSILAAETDWDD